MYHKYLSKFTLSALMQFSKVKFRNFIFKVLNEEIEVAIKKSVIKELKDVLKIEINTELKNELAEELNNTVLEFKTLMTQTVNDKINFLNQIIQFKLRAIQLLADKTDDNTKFALKGELSKKLRSIIREYAGLPQLNKSKPNVDDLIKEISFIRINHQFLTPAFKVLLHKRALFAGQAYYNSWYLSRALRGYGWKADVLNWDMNPDTQIYYHGEDFSFDPNSPTLIQDMLDFYVHSLYDYDVFHFSNSYGITFGWPVQQIFDNHFSHQDEIRLLKQIGKKIVYSNNGCLDGVSQTSFSKWGPDSVCSICKWQNEPIVCNDHKNLTWGQFRNEVADFQCLLGGNRVDYNIDPKIHEVPEFYCLDPELWQPDIVIPERYKIRFEGDNKIFLYHAVGNLEQRTKTNGHNIKSSHIYLPLIEKLKEEGVPVELVSPSGVPNKEVRYYQAQSDIFLEMLSFGWFGANAREAMMLGKSVICYIRPEWLESLRDEIPEYAEELPIVSATEQTVEAVLRELIANPDKRRDIGRRSRAFALKWHSSQAGGRRFNTIYSRLIAGDTLMRVNG